MKGMGSCTLACWAPHAAAIRGGGPVGPPGLLCEAGGWAMLRWGAMGGTRRLFSGLLSLCIVGSCLLTCCPPVDGELPKGCHCDFCSSPPTCLLRVQPKAHHMVCISRWKECLPSLGVLLREQRSVRVSMPDPGAGSESVLEVRLGS